MFSTCFEHGNVDTVPFYESCWHDVCFNRDDEDEMKKAACGIYQTVAAECENEGINIYWGEETEGDTKPTSVPTTVIPTTTNVTPYGR